MATGVTPGVAMSRVMIRFSRMAATAFSMAAAGSSRPRLYLSSMAADRIWAMGLAMPWPAMSGAEPPAGSNMPNLELFRLAEASMPMEPVSMAASSLMMSPNMLPQSMTSNWCGSRTSCMVALSM